MIKHIFRAAILIGFATVTYAQSTSAPVATKDAWEVYLQKNPYQCWVSSKPDRSTATRGGKKTTVTRGSIQLYATYRAGGADAPEISFTGGYPFAEKSEIALKVGDETFTLYPSGEWAWAKDSAADALIVAAMMKGASATLIGKSARGTQTEDRFSLKGISAALKEAKALCE